MTPPVDLSEVSTAELICRLHAALARLRVAVRLVGKSRESIS